MTCTGIQKVCKLRVDTSMKKCLTFMQSFRYSPGYDCQSEKIQGLVSGCQTDAEVLWCTCGYRFVPNGFTVCLQKEAGRAIRSSGITGVPC